MNKRGMHPIVIAITFIAALITILMAAGVVNLDNAVASITGSGQYIERPFFKYVKCEAVSGYKYSTEYSIANGGSWIVKPSVTNQYDVKVKYPSTIQGKRIEYYICNSRVLSESNCRVYSNKISVTSSSGTIEINNVRPEEVVWVQYARLGLTGWYGSDGAVYQVGFIPYGLREYNVLGGSSNQINPNSCEVSVNDDSWKDRLLSTNIDKVNSEISKNVNERVLQPEEVRWFVAGYVTSAEPSFALRYSGKDAWCRPTGTNAEIYQINTVQVGSGTYKIASADWSDYLGSETCCPGDKQGDMTCNSYFKWEKTQGTQCSAFNSCGGADWSPYSEKQIIKYSCVNGYCKSEIKEVECANDYDCKDANEVCDLNSHTCTDANVNLDGQEIITIPDNKVDCDKKGGTWITETSEEKSILNWLGVGEPKVIVEEYCELKKPFNYVFWIAIAIIILVVFIFRNQLLAGFRLILSKLGVKI